ncbi:peroxiredoxin [Bradyrhizobium daqingense]|uniref:thioredoxin-dependent peroxiredoxin n=1 Tax=Bradyrhizobium daqingense TaxID=993502 RepID=A0A562LFR5_9BRAD|nr:peroxiredoxin [Bradyrhizobium daqingense]TWI06457.1 peroxiredoxin Q/BCP [Bradyrhizobium daqingense]UFS86622.1 peroxiredoxin [Bradyrhizobium daqingense]
MSKKSRKKSSKTPSGSPTAKKKAGKTRAATQTRSAKTQRTPASKSTATIAKAASHKAASKQLNPSKSPAAAAPTLTEGQKAPAFRLSRDGGELVTLADHAGRKLVLFFYPRADTPGCTREAIDFTRLADAFASAGTAVLGISADPLKAQEKFRDKHKLGIPLASDETHAMLEAYGAWGEKSMYGKTFLGILRTTVLVGGDGKIARIWRNVKVDGHADEVLEAARSL